MRRAYRLTPAGPRETGSRSAFYRNTIDKTGSIRITLSAMTHWPIDKRGPKEEETRCCLDPRRQGLRIIDLTMKLNDFLVTVLPTLQLGRLLFHPFSSSLSSSSSLPSLTSRRWSRWSRSVLRSKLQFFYMKPVFTCIRARRRRRRRRRRGGGGGGGGEGREGGRSKRRSRTRRRKRKRFEREMERRPDSIMHGGHRHTCHGESIRSGCKPT